MNASHLSRRGFLQKAGLFAAATGLGRLGSLTAHAQTAPSDYKALVCVFLTGGNDGHNMIVPLNGPELTNYRAARGSLALPDGNTAVLPVTALNGTPYGLNGGLAALHPLWAQGRMAAVANVGVLVRPTSRAQYLGATVGLPTNLFSHSDQVLSMQAGDPFGSAVRAGPAELRTRREPTTPRPPFRRRSRWRDRRCSARATLSSRPVSFPVST